MNIIHSLRSGFSRMVKSWKGILIIWFSSLILAAILTVPLLASLKRSYGTSMITDELMEGLNIEVFADLGSNLRLIMSFVSPGLAFVLLVGLIITAFLNGGLFNSLRYDAGKFSASDFFGAGARNFWSFLLIAIIIRGLLLLMSVIFIIIPMAVLLPSGGLPGNTDLIIFIITAILYLILMPVIFLVADYARAWQVTNVRLSGLKAIGFGFRKAFDRFRNSYFLMVILLIIQILYIFLLINLIPFWKPKTGSGTFILLLVSQLMLYIRFAVKAWRFASVTVSGEPYTQEESAENDIPDIV